MACSRVQLAWVHVIRQAAQPAGPREDALACRQMAEPPAARPIKALFLDFDSTISTPTFIQRANAWAVADNLQLFLQMNEQEIIANLGGAERIATIASLLQALETRGVRLHIISIGMKAAIVPHLRAAKLLPFFTEERIWGQDCPELRGESHARHVEPYARDVRAMLFVSRRVQVSVS